MDNREKSSVLTDANIIGTFVLEAYNSGQSIDSLKFSFSSTFSVKRILITNEDGVVVYDSFEQDSLKGKLFLINPTVRSALYGKELSSVVDADKDNIYVEASAPVTINKKVLYVVYVSKNIQASYDGLKESKNNLLLISIIASLFIGFASYLLARIITKPIGVIVKATNEIAKGDFDILIDDKGKSELSVLANSINLMSAQLKELEEKRKIFVSDASHELKTPITSIKLMTDSLLENPMISKETQEEFLNDINSECLRLSKIVDQLLMLTSPYPNINEPPNNESHPFISLSNIAKEVVSKNQKIADNNKINLDSSISEDISYNCDIDKIWAVFYNLISNAIKYTEENGSVFVSLKKEDKNIIFSVKDDGIGIQNSDQEKIFERFYRVDKARTRGTGGTGLGLAIVKDIVDKYHGTIDVISEEGKGSEFIVTLPVN